MIFNLSLFLTTLLLAIGTQTGYAKDKVALLFLTRSAPNHPELWKTLLSEAPDRFNLYFHSKEPLEDPYFQPHRIAKIVPTSWSIHAKAWQVLLQEAIKDPENVRFVFLSESCIPLYSLRCIYTKIMSDTFTHMFFRRPWWPVDNPRELRSVKPKFRYGNWEWMILNRNHAELVAADRKLIKIVAKHENDQESYFATLFAMHGCLEDQTINQTYTYMNWEHAVNGGASPYPFKEVSFFNDALIEEAYQSGALFARKFSSEYPTQELLNMVRKNTKKHKRNLISKSQHI